MTASPTKPECQGCLFFVGLNGRLYFKCMPARVYVLLWASMEDRLSWAILWGLGPCLRHFQITDPGHKASSDPLVSCMWARSRESLWTTKFCIILLRVLCFMLMFGVWVRGLFLWGHMKQVLFVWSHWDLGFAPLSFPRSLFWMPDGVSMFSRLTQPGRIL